MASVFGVYHNTIRVTLPHKELTFVSGNSNNRVGGINSGFLGAPGEARLYKIGVCGRFLSCLPQFFFRARRMQREDGYCNRYCRACEHAIAVAEADDTMQFSN